MYSNRPNAGLLVNYGLRSALNGGFYFLSGAYELNLYAVVFASSVAILVKSVDSISSFMLQLLKQSD